VDLRAEILELPVRTFWAGNSLVDLRYLASSALLFALLLGDGNVRRGLVRVWQSLDLARSMRTRSAHLDLLVFVVNAIAFSSLIGAATGWGPQAKGVGRTLGSALTFWTDQAVLGRVAAGILQAVLFVLLADLWVYLVHRSMHRVPFLWAFHKVHHSATELTPLTVFRLHPAELVLILLPSVTLSSFASGLVGELGGPGVASVRFLGANAALALFFLFGAAYRHSRLWVVLPGPLRHVIHSPAHHQIHHSADPADFNTNFSSNLLIWDRMFGTLRDPAGRAAPERLGLGDDQRVERMHRNPVGVYAYPFIDAIKSLVPVSYRARTR
jgi:sterol desaturase/sphingolipid hydroxylase (fatty acid hydroxylase superfamily)